MSKSRSKRYPSMSLEQAIERVGKAYDADRQNTIDRETMAQHIGYSGISGASDQAIGTLTQYGLVERAGRGEMRVSTIALDILHPAPGQDSGEALKIAAFHPSVFQELLEKFPDRPSESGLKSYLKREGFLDRAVNLIASAYLENWSYLAANGLSPSNNDRVEPSEEQFEEIQASTESVRQPIMDRFVEKPAQFAGGPIEKAYVFPFPAGGEASILLPQSLTQREYEDFLEWINMMGRQAQRRVIESSPNSADANLDYS